MYETVRHPSGTAAASFWAWWICSAILSQVICLPTVAFRAPDTWQCWFGAAFVSIIAVPPLAMIWSTHLAGCGIISVDDVTPEHVDAMFRPASAAVGGVLLSLLAFIAAITLVPVTHRATAWAMTFVSGVLLAVSVTALRIITQREKDRSNVEA